MAQTTKKQLRKHVKEKVHNLAPDYIEACSLAVTRNICQLKQWTEASTVGVYLSMSKAEVNTDSLLDTIFQSPTSTTCSTRHYSGGGTKNVLVPHINGQTMELLPFNLADYFSLKELRTWSTKTQADDKLTLFLDSWGIPSFKPSLIAAKREELQCMEQTLAHSPMDVILVPGVAFDEVGNRCGHGKGYYDRYFAALKTRYQDFDSMLRVGIAFEEQVFEHILSDDHDEPLHALVSPKKVRWFERRIG
jgi:5-formyltetrahydrofolate cyclo-ligase